MFPVAPVLGKKRSREFFRQANDSQDTQTRETQFLVPISKVALPTSSVFLNIPPQHIHEEPVWFNS